MYRTVVLCVLLVLPACKGKPAVPVVTQQPRATPADAKYEADQRANKQRYNQRMKAVEAKHVRQADATAKAMRQWQTVNDLHDEAEADFRRRYPVGSKVDWRTGLGKLRDKNNQELKQRLEVIRKGE